MILAVVHMAVAWGIDRSVPIILNEVDFSLTSIVAAAISSPVLALISRNHQIDWLIILRTQRPNKYGARIIELRIGKALDIQSAIIIWLTELDAETHLSQARGTKQRSEQS